MTNRLEVKKGQGDGLGGMGLLGVQGILGGVWGGGVQDFGFILV